MKVSELVDEVLAGLPDETRELVDEHVSISVRRRPNAEDLTRGCLPDLKGCFWGFPMRDEEHDEEIWRSDDGDDIADPEEYEPGGEIVLFLDNIKPLTRDNVAQVLLHEFAHFLGEDEGAVAELGLADDLGDEEDAA